MNEHYLTIPFDEDRPLQEQIQERLVDAILGGHLPVDEPLPSSRKLASQLGVSRNTVMLVYERMVDAGYLGVQLPPGIFHRTGVSQSGSDRRACGYRRGQSLDRVE